MGVNSVYSFASTYGCTPGQIIHDATDRFKADINASREATNQQIQGIQQNKNAQPKQWQEGQIKSGGGSKIPYSSRGVQIYYADINDSGEDMMYGDKSLSALKQTKGISDNSFGRWDFSYTTGKKKWVEYKEEDYYNDFKMIAKSMSHGAMETVALDMVRHFADGTGSVYRNSVLTKAVAENDATQSFTRGVIKALHKALGMANGDISKIAKNNTGFRNILKEMGLILSQYNYGAFSNGLGYAIHQWSKLYISISNFRCSQRTYIGTINFTFIDNFGVDSGDIGELKDIVMPFSSWYILQHYNKYKGKYRPFKTIVELEYPISGILK
jgi:hypothetical protein